MTKICRGVLAGLVVLYGSIEAGRAATNRIVTTFLPLYSIAANVAGDLASVENLLSPNVSPHDYQLSPQDGRRLSAAGLVVVSGLGLEASLASLIKKRDRGIVEAAAGLGDKLIRSNDKHHGPWNPHFWLDPTLIAHAATNVLRALQQADRRNASAYASNAIAYVERLHRLDAEIESALAPYKGQPIVTYHDAYPYLARRYGLKVVGVVEPVPDIDPSPRHLSALRKTIGEHSVRVIFTDKGGSTRLAERLSADLNVKLVALDPLESGNLTPSAYEDGMRANVRVLQETLRASVP